MAEKKYIDADEAFEIITDFAGQADTKSAYKAFWKAAKALKTQPAADVAEVVRCKDCKYSHENDYSIKCELHIPYCYEVNENGFCSKGTKMDGGDK